MRTARHHLGDCIAVIFIARAVVLEIDVEHFSRSSKAGMI